MTTAWTFDDIPDQTGRTAIVTGANTGIGLETASMLARKGASVVLACRNLEKGKTALARLEGEKPAGQVSLAELDLSDLESVAAFSDAFLAKHDRLDLLIDNAGVMVPPLGHTKQGFEMQLGTNHFGHFALTAHLLPLLERTPGSRVVVVSSGAQFIGNIDFDDLDWKKRSYSPWRAYGASKLANMMFVLELQRRLDAAGSKVRVTGAHPGYTATDLQRSSAVARLMNPIMAMKAHDGALPTLRAAVDPEAEGGSYWGPGGFLEMNGPPVRAKISARARDAAVAKRLFDVSEERARVSFPFSRKQGAAAAAQAS